MKRSIAVLSSKEFDLVVVGGGIFGICAAWDATLRGLSVALVERGDFAGATSANCFKIVHGGIRYLQHADFVRIRQSSQERNVLLKIAPHLVRPLPIAIPTYGHGMKGKEVLAAGLLLYDLITCDRNQGLKDHGRRIPRGRFVSRTEALGMFPGLNPKGLTGAAIIHDGQMYSAPRLALAFLMSATSNGAEAANYVEAIRCVRSGDHVCGIEARDRLTGERFQIRGKIVLNAAGPWAERWLGQSMGLGLRPGGTYSRDAYFIVPKPLMGDCALAVSGRTKDPDAILSRNARHLFIVPWKDYTMIGVWHLVHEGPPDAFTVTETELEQFIQEINEAYPALGLTLDDVSMWNAGLVLFGENSPEAVNLSYGKRSRIVDHALEHGVDGLITLIGVRYTTARSDAEKAIDLALRKLGRPPRKCATTDTPIYGGRIECFEELVGDAITHCPPLWSIKAVRSLVHNHGTEYRSVFKYLNEDPTWYETINGSEVAKAEVVYAVREEMAQKLEDVVFRRTALGAGSYPSESAIKVSAELMASELKWDAERTRRETEDLKASFRGRVRQGAPHV